MFLRNRVCTFPSQSHNIAEMSMKKKKIEQYTVDLNTELGSGSYGTVYKGYDDINNRAVAVKVLSKSKSTSVSILVDKDDYTKKTVFL